jgi:secreted PhoX family phosphatase
VKGQENTSTNTSSTPAFAAILRQDVSRRQVVWGGLVAAGMTLADGAGLVRVRRRAEASTPLLGFQNCAHGVTPWGTYLTCEENFNGYFVNVSGDIEGVADATQKLSLLKSQNRYGITKTGFGYRWHEHDARFDAARHPHEPHRFGWVVEIDPFDPQRQPIKHTALGRFKHEGA